MATHSSVLAWRIPRTGEPGRLLSMGSHRVRHDWSDLAAAAAAEYIMRNSGLEEVQAGIKIAGRHINNLRYADDTTLMAEKWRRTKEPLNESERREWKSWLKAQHSENEDNGIWSHHFMANRQWKQWQTLSFGAPKSLQMVIAAMKLKDSCSLEGRLWPT